jgi:hypothetical protein
MRYWGTAGDPRTLDGDAREDDINAIIYGLDQPSRCEMSFESKHVAHDVGLEEFTSEAR